MKLYDYRGKCNMSGEHIREQREEMGLSQEGLAGKLQLLGLEISQNAISRIERGLRVVPDYELKYFARVFNKPVEWFLEE